MRCDKCGRRMWTICNACGVWVGDCKHRNTHKDKAWSCDGCDNKIDKAFENNALSSESETGEKK